MGKYRICFGSLLILLAGWTLASCEMGDSPQPQGVTYSTEVAPIISNYCLTCHSGTDPVAGLKLEAYSDLKAIGESGKLLDRINDSEMPMPPGGLLTVERRETIKNWIEGGYQR